MGRGSGRGDFRPLFQEPHFWPLCWKPYLTHPPISPLFQYQHFWPLFQDPQLTCLTEPTSQLGRQTGSRGLNGAWQGRSPAVSRPAILAAVLEPAVDVSGETDVTARQPDWWPRPEWGVAVGVRRLFQNSQLSHVF